MKLTASAVADLELPDGKAEETCWDEDLAGFGVRMRSSGHKSFTVQYAIGGKTKRVPLGNVTEIELGKARRLAKDLLAQIRLGGDPAHDKTKARVRAGETFGSLIKPFMIRQQGLLKPRSLVETRRHLEKLCKPLHPLPITAIDRRTIAARLVEITSTSGPSAANRARGSLGAFYTWCIGQGLLETNPVSLIPKAIERGPRSRLLSDDELALIWQALDADDYGTVVRLLILTGLRRGEIGELLWSEIDLAANLITVPPSRTKNGRAHLLPMSSAVRGVIEARPRQADRDRVFRMSAWNNAKVALDKRIAEIGDGPLAPWCLHDIRRLFSTRLHDELGVAPHIVETLLGHTGHKSGVSGTYNLATYLPESRRALDRWSDRVMSIVTGAPVTAEVIQLHA
jgi:integrase